MPNLDSNSVKTAFSVKTNDELMLVYLSSLVRSVLAMHHLIDNKIENRAAEKLGDDKVSGKKEGTEDAVKDVVMSEA